MKLDRDQQGPGHPELSENRLSFQVVAKIAERAPAPLKHAFCARRQDLPWSVRKTAGRDCFTGIRPILKSCLSAASEKPTGFPVPLPRIHCKTL
jgi:hypothetical protein